MTSRQADKPNQPVTSVTVILSGQWSVTSMTMVVTTRQPSRQAGRQVAAEMAGGALSAGAKEAVGTDGGARLRVGPWAAPRAPGVVYPGQWRSRDVLRM
jgi:hypothetical protein